MRRAASLKSSCASPLTTRTWHRKETREHSHTVPESFRGNGKTTVHAFSMHANISQALETFRSRILRTQGAGVENLRSSITPYLESLQLSTGTSNRYQSGSSSIISTLPNPDCDIQAIYSDIYHAFLIIFSPEKHLQE